MFLMIMIQMQDGGGYVKSGALGIEKRGGLESTLMSVRVCVRARA